MDVVVSGSHGLIGSALLPALTAAGHRVRRLVRGAAGAGEVAWDPEAGTVDAAGLAGADAVVHLAGVGIGDKRWTQERKRRIRESRVTGTATLAAALAGLPEPPAVLVSGSAVGYYGDRGDEVLTEDSGPGTGFLADAVRDWEGATAPAADAGVRVVHTRTGVVQTPEGGALAKQLPLFRLGLGGPLGWGRHWVSWVSIDDEVGAILHALGTDSLRGPVNLCAPEPATSTAMARAIGHALRRPAVLPVPGFAIGVAVGRQMTGEMVLASQRAVPEKLVASGYRFRHADVGAAMDDLLRR